MNVAIFQHRPDHRWHFGDADLQPWCPHALSQGYRTNQEATQAAITAWHGRGEKLAAITGRGDRKICRANGVKYLDPRGNARRSTPALLRYQIKREHRLSPGESREAQRAADWSPGEKSPAIPRPVPPPPATRNPLSAGERAGVMAGVPATDFTSPPPISAPPETTTAKILGLRPAPDSTAVAAKALDRIFSKVPPAITPKQKSIKQARGRRAISRPRQAPEGYRSYQHFIQELKATLARCGRHGVRDLARHMDLDKTAVQRWLRGKRRPVQKTIETLSLWMQTKV